MPITLGKTFTDLGFDPRPLPRSAILRLPRDEIRIIFEWSWAMQGAGDGNSPASGVMDFKDLHDELYHYITAILFYTDDTTTLNSCQLTTDSDNWDDTVHTGHADEIVTLWSAKYTGAVACPDNDWRLKKPIYLGRLNNGNANGGELTAFFGIGTNAKLFNVSIKGYSLERPLPYNTILQV